MLSIRWDERQKLDEQLSPQVLKEREKEPRNAGVHYVLGSRSLPSSSLVTIDDNVMFQKDSITGVSPGQSPNFLHVKLKSVSRGLLKATILRCLTMTKTMTTLTAVRERVQPD